MRSTLAFTNRLVRPFRVAAAEAPWVPEFFSSTGGSPYSGSLGWQHRPRPGGVPAFWWGAWEHSQELPAPGTSGARYGGIESWRMVSWPLCAVVFLAGSVWSWRN